MSMSLCGSVCKDISGTTRAILPNFFVHVAYVHGSVLLWHVHDRPHRREGVFFTIENALSAEKGGWECTAWAKYAIYDCLVCIVVLFYNITAFIHFDVII